MDSLRSWMIAGLLLFSGSYAFAIGPSQFVKHNPFGQKFLSLSPKSFQTIKVLNNGTFEMQFFGTIISAKELFLDQRQIPIGKHKTVSGVFRLKRKEEIHEIRMVDEDDSENSFYFQVNLKKELPSPLRVRFRTEKGKIIERVEFNLKTLAARDWVNFEWLSEDEVLSPEELELKEMARKRKKLQAALEEEQQNLARLEEERKQLSERQGGVLGATDRRPMSKGVSLEPMESFVQICQGIGFLNLEQSQQPTVETAQWMVEFATRRSSSKGWEAGIHGKGFVIPLSKNLNGSNPRFMKLGLDVGTQISLSDRGTISPRAGFDYQSLITSSALGYRNLMGPRLELAGEYSLSKSEIIKSEIFLNLFGSDFSVISSSNYQWGARLSYQWETNFLSARSLLAGAEISRLNLVLSNAQLKSNLMTTFVGIRF